MNAKIIKIVLALASIGAAAPVSAAMAQTVTIQEYGGGGGDDFRRECPAGEYMTGVEGRRGAWIDAIAPRCARWDAVTQSFGPAHALELAGGNGGEQAVAYCSAPPLIRSMAVNTTRTDRSYVDLLYLHCRDRSNTAYSHAVFNGKDEDFERLSNFVSCPEDYVAVGLHGRAGDYLDAIGLLCAPLPPVIVKPPGIGGISKAPPPTKTPTDVPASSGRLGGGVLKVGRPDAQLPSPAENPPAQNPPAPAMTQRYDAPTILSDEGIEERVDYCLNFAADCGEAAAATFCAAKDPNLPRPLEAPLEFGVGRTFTIGDRQLCQQENCSSFTHIICSAQ